MPTDATGTPTSPDSIPTFNTSVDAPSGLGFNAAMASIQTALSARVSKPSGVTTGDVPVWNGSTWVRPTGTADATHFVRGDSTWATPPGTELAYQLYTTDQTTTATSFTDLFTFSAATFENVKHYLEIVVPHLQASTANNAIQFRLVESASQVGELVQFDGHATAGSGVSAYYRMPFTPSAASHTYKVQWFVVAAATATIKATLGDATFRIVKA